jgi:HSPB1-associated protein 1
MGTRSAKSIIYLLVKVSHNFLYKKCIDWSAFGFLNRNANDSTLWLGTKDAYTPCHFDTYGYNLIFQAYGTYVF